MEQNLLEKLNKEQLKAVQHDTGPLLIVAGAGTGKTTVITQRIAYLIEQGKAQTDEVLALTFTEKAAGEMEERVDRLLPMGYTDLWISTFHSFGEKILNAHGLDIGLPTEPRLMNEFEQWALVRENLDQFDLDYYRPMGNPTKFIHALIKHFSRLKDEDISPKEYLKYAEELRENLDSMLSGSKKKVSSIKYQVLSITNEKGEVDKEIATQEVRRINEVANAYHVYQQLLLNNNALDFGDLINYTLKLFRERPKALEFYRQQFKYILLDEFQDTNWAQYELIKLLSAPKNNLVVVGDDDQSIYKFRGASVSNILEFKKDFKLSKEIVLTMNYRNTQDILDLSYDFIQLNNPNRLEYKLQSKEAKLPEGSLASGLSKKLKANNKSKGMIEVIEGEDLSDEIRRVVERVAELKIKDKDATWNEFAILVRANESAKQVTSMLETAGLPYQYLASRGLYAKPLIMDIVSYFRLLDNYHESAAVYRVLNFSVLDFSEKEIMDFNFIAGKKAWSLYTVLRNSAGKFGPETQTKIDKVLTFIDKHTALTRHKNALEIFISVLNDIGYLEHISKLNEREAQEQIGYLNQFKKRLEKFEAAQDDKSVKAFLNELNQEIEAGGEGALIPDIEAGPETIKVMTVHAAKGLEFKYVFVASLVDKRFPTIRRQEPILIPDALIKEELPEGDIHLEEERRLFYVALTRAKKGIFFSWAPDYGGIRKKKPSQFLVECKLVDTSKTGKIGKTGKEFEIKKIERHKDSAPIDYQPPTYFSFSKLTAFRNCPYQYRFSYVLKVPTKNKHYFSFGKTIHASLQKIFELVAAKRDQAQGNLFAENDKAKEAKPVEISWDEVKPIYSSAWIDNWYQSEGQKKEYYEKGKEQLKEFLSIYNGAWPRAVYIEKGFKNKIQGLDNQLYTIGGTIDRVDEVDGKLKLVDYKTGSPKEKLHLDDKFQLLIYQMAAQSIFKREIDSLVFYYLENNTGIEFLGTDEELSNTQDKIVKTINDIREGEFPPSPGPLCKHCDFFNICEYRKN